jgi:hypothetical protein
MCSLPQHPLRCCCRQAYHPLCARRVGLHMEMADPAEPCTAAAAAAARRTNQLTCCAHVLPAATVPTAAAATFHISIHQVNLPTCAPLHCRCCRCHQAYHPLCARRVGLHMEMVDPAEPDGPLQLVSHCPKHCTPSTHASGAFVVVRALRGSMCGTTLCETQSSEPYTPLRHASGGVRLH